MKDSRDAVVLRWLRYGRDEIIRAYLDLTRKEDHGTDPSERTPPTEDRGPASEAY